METKSRYQVIGELEAQKRQLINEKNALKDGIVARQKKIKEIERQKVDTIVVLDRQIDDAREDLSTYESGMEERKSTIDLLIKSVDDSLARFNGTPQS